MVFIIQVFSYFFKCCVLILLICACPVYHCVICVYAIRSSDRILPINTYLLTYKQTLLKIPNALRYTTTLGKNPNHEILMQHSANRLCLVVQLTWLSNVHYHESRAVQHCADVLTSWHVSSCPPNLRSISPRSIDTQPSAGFHIPEKSTLCTYYHNKRAKRH